MNEEKIRNCFTEVEEGVNAEFNKAIVKCFNSTNNAFSMDCEGNLIVNSLMTRGQNSLIPDMPILIDSRSILGSPVVGTGPVAKTTFACCGTYHNLDDSEGFNLLKGVLFNFPVPEGWHPVYRVSMHYNTVSSNNITVTLNNLTLINKAGVWGPHPWENTVYSNFFTEEEIILEPTVQLNRKGLNFIYTVEDTENNSYSIHVIFLNTYLVRD